MPVQLVHLGVELTAHSGGQQVEPLEHLGHAPALIAVEAEDQGRGGAPVSFPTGHRHQLIAQELVADPAKGQRHLAFLALDQLQLARVTAFQPGQELKCVAHRGRQQQQPNVGRQHAKGQLPDNASLQVGEVMELVHDHGRDLLEVEIVGMEQSIEQDLRDDDEDAGVGIEPAVAGRPGRSPRARSPSGRPHSCISRNFCSVRAISGVV